MNSNVDEIFNEIVDVYAKVCYCYVRDVGKLGAQYNGIAFRWFKESSFNREMGNALKTLKKASEDLSREDKYEVLMELYAIKPGIHEAFFPKGHKWQILKKMRQRMVSGYGPSSMGEATYMLKSLVCVDNLQGSGRPLFEAEPNCAMPYSSDQAQELTLFYLESTDWRSLDELRPIDSWSGYANCAIDEGPLLLTRGERARGNINDIVKTPEIVDYKMLTSEFKRTGEGVWK